jgi:hypothetical protein
MEHTKEKREFLIDYKIFTKDNAISLIKIFIDSSIEILEKSKDNYRKELIEKGYEVSVIGKSDIDRGYSKLEFTDSDHSKYTTRFEDITETIDILSNRRIIEITLFFSEQVFNSRFKINIKHSDSHSTPGYVIVEGKDSEWVNNTMKILRNFFSTCRSQSTFVKENKLIIVATTVLTLNFFLNNSIGLIALKMHLFPKFAMMSLSKDWMFFTVILSLITLSPAFLIYQRLIKIWPRIEIQTGKDFRQIQREKRKKVLLLTSIIIVPTVISFLLRLL